MANEIKELIKHTDKGYIFGEVYYKLKELKEEGK